MQMGVAAELQIGEDNRNHMSTSNIWLNRRSASCKGAARSNHCDIGPKKKTSGSDNKATDQGDASKKEKKLCLCAPTTHAGSFRCRLHRATETANAHNSPASSSMKCRSTGKTSYSSRNLDVQALPHLSRFGRAVVAASDGANGSRPISMALQNDEKFCEPYKNTEE